MNYNMMGSISHPDIEGQTGNIPTEWAHIRKQKCDCSLQLHLLESVWWHVITTQFLGFQMLQEKWRTAPALHHQRRNDAEVRECPVFVMGCSLQTQSVCEPDGVHSRVYMMSTKSPAWVLKIMTPRHSWSWRGTHPALKEFLSSSHWKVKMKSFLLFKEQPKLKRKKVENFFP